MRVLKGLLWKEWKQHNRGILLIFIIISLEPILIPITYWIYRTSERAEAWSDGIKAILTPGTSNTEILAMIAVVLLASVLLVGERDSSLNYLVTTPVSRREIISAKFIYGSLVLITIMLIISLFILIARILFPAEYSAQEVIQWTIITTLALLCMFSLALMVASFSRGVLSSALFTTVIMGLPWILVSFMMQVFSQFKPVSAALEIKARYLVTYLFIPDYISRDGRYIWSSNSNLVIDRVIPDYPLEITILLLASFLFWRLAIKIFEKNPLERQGELLLFGSFKQNALIFISCISAMGWARQVASSLLSFFAFFLIMWLGIYLAMLALAWIITWFVQFKKY